MTTNPSSAPRLDDDRITVERAPYTDPRGEIDELRTLLQGSPRQIPAKYFYDDRGSELFERITRLPEYYQTRTERALLEHIAPALVARTGAEELVEIGAGAATKTRVLLDTMAKHGSLRRYVPLDVSEGTLRRAAQELIEEYPGLLVHGIVGDFMRHLGHLPAGGRRLVLFLGGTIGNLQPEPDATDFLRSLSRELEAEDHLLLGTDLIKEPALIEAAYNDSQGLTAEFNRNILRVLNHRFGADFEPRSYAHSALFVAERHRIEMWLTATSHQEVEIPGLDLELDLEEGERIRTEISTKYDREKAEELLAHGGFELEEWYHDEQRLFSLSLARKAT